MSFLTPALIGNRRLRETPEGTRAADLARATLLGGDPSGNGFVGRKTLLGQ